MSQKPYWQQRQELKLKGAKPPEVKRQEKKAKGVFFASQLAKAPKNCENCGKSLAGTKAINPAAIICHIIPKNETSGCPSVATHPLNRWFGCGDCHTNYDNQGVTFVKSMPIFEELKKRVATFYEEIDPKERRRVPVYFRPAK